MKRTVKISKPCMECGGSTHAQMQQGGNWIQDATASMEQKGTIGKCTGTKFGGPDCPKGSPQYNLAKTFRNMAKNQPKKKMGGVAEQNESIDNITGDRRSTLMDHLSRNAQNAIMEETLIEQSQGMPKTEFFNGGSNFGFQVDPNKTAMMNLYAGQMGDLNKQSKNNMNSFTDAFKNANFGREKEYYYDPNNPEAKDYMKTYKTEFKKADRNIRRSGNPFQNQFGGVPAFHQGGVAHDHPHRWQEPQYSDNLYDGVPLPYGQAGTDRFNSIIAEDSPYGDPELTNPNTGQPYIQPDWMTDRNAQYHKSMYGTAMKLNPYDGSYYAVGEDGQTAKDPETARYLKEMAFGQQMHDKGWAQDAQGNWNNPEVKTASNTNTPSYTTPPFKEEGDNAKSAIENIANANTSTGTQEKTEEEEEAGNVDAGKYRKPDGSAQPNQSGQPMAGGYMSGGRGYKNTPIWMPTPTGLTQGWDYTKERRGPLGLGGRRETWHYAGMPQEGNPNTPVTSPNDPVTQDPNMTGPPTYADWMEMAKSNPFASQTAGTPTISGADLEAESNKADADMIASQEKSEKDQKQAKKGKKEVREAEVIDAYDKSNYDFDPENPTGTDAGQDMMINKYNQQYGGTPQYFLGGVFDSIGEGVSSAVSGIGEGVSNFAGNIGDPVGGFAGDAIQGSSDAFGNAATTGAKVAFGSAAIPAGLATAATIPAVVAGRKVHNKAKGMAKDSKGGFGMFGNNNARYGGVPEFKNGGPKGPDYWEKIKAKSREYYNQGKDFYNQHIADPNFPTDGSQYGLTPSSPYYEEPNVPMYRYEGANTGMSKDQFYKKQIEDEGYYRDEGANTGMSRAEWEDKQGMKQYGGAPMFQTGGPYTEDGSAYETWDAGKNAIADTVPVVGAWSKVGKAIPGGWGDPFGKMLQAAEGQGQMQQHGGTPQYFFGGGAGKERRQLRREERQERRADRQEARDPMNYLDPAGFFGGSGNNASPGMIGNMFSGQGQGQGNMGAMFQKQQLDNVGIANAQMDTQQYGGVVQELTPGEIEQILAMGGKVEYLD